ncbi:hypothetical protein LFL97_01795 [Burkholderia sp. JSH-S8]|uniref:hypothetical protein n=1 Tax=Burkholderia stagnalis TaxID=1503054 RepID=UPI0012E3947A|nr:hypothetical protein [Burkholderia stagnalis]WGS42295.1 hypothetical protein LFL97_01795 [Burkholderia sp. JSH-S8]
MIRLFAVAMLAAASTARATDTSEKRCHGGKMTLAHEKALAAARLLGIRDAEADRLAG